MHDFSFQNHKHIKVHGLAFPGIRGETGIYDKKGVEAGTEEKKESLRIAQSSPRIMEVHYNIRKEFR